MNLNKKTYNEYIESSKEEVARKELYSPIALNKKTFLFPIKNSDIKLVISLNHFNPLLYFVKNKEIYPSIELEFLTSLKDNIKGLIIDNISLLNDEIVFLSFKDSDIKLVVELFKYRSNIIIIKNNKLIDLFYKPNDRLKIDEKYEIPSNEDAFNKTTYIDEEYLNKHFENELKIKEEEKYAFFINYLSNRIKRNERKIKNINNDLLKAKENLKYQDYADNIYCLNLDLKGHYKSIDINDEVILLDESKRLKDNIDSFYKISKKAKQTILLNESNIENAKKELSEYQSLLNRFKNANSEKEKEKIVLESNFIKKKQEIKETSFNHPYKINLNGTIIYFGKNANQNDYLTFVKKLDREFYFFHIKDHSGSHIVLANKKPTENELIFASELALYLSKVKSGNVIYSKKKNVRRGSRLGEVKFKNYSTIKINNIQNNIKEYVDKAVRVN